jgi:hypothetical protein
MDMLIYQRYEQEGKVVTRNLEESALVPSTLFLQPSNHQP